MTHEAPWSPQEVWARAEVRPDPPAELRQVDRCDHGGEPAMERWENGQTELLFCKHHANQHRAALIAAGWVLTESWRFELTTRVVKSQSKDPKTRAITNEEDHIRGLTRVREV